MSARAHGRADALTVPRHALPGHAADSRRRQAATIGAIAGFVFILSYPRALEDVVGQVFAWTVLALGIGLALLPRRTPGTVPPTLLLVLAWLAASMLWSQDQSATLAAVALYGAFALVAWVAASHVRPEDVPVGVAAGLGLIIATSVAATLLLQEVVPGWTPWARSIWGEVSYQGVYGNRNILAYTVVMAVPGLLRLHALRRAALPLAVVLAAATGVMLFISESSTGLLAASVLVAAASAAFVHRTVTSHTSRRTRRRIAVVGGVGLAACVVALSAVAIDALARKSTTLSGRTPLWGSIIDVSADRPLLGFGWGAVWSYRWLPPTGANPVRTAINASLGAPLSHGHNAALDLLPQVGLVGVGLVVALQVRAVVRLVRAAPSPARGWGLLTLLAINVVGVSEPTWSTPLGWFLLVMVAVVAERLPRRSVAVADPTTTSTARGGRRARRAARRKAV